MWIPREYVIPGTCTYHTYTSVQQPFQAQLVGATKHLTGVPLQLNKKVYRHVLFTEARACHNAYPGRDKSGTLWRARSGNAFPQYGLWKDFCEKFLNGLFLAGICIVCYQKWHFVLVLSITRTYRQLQWLVFKFKTFMDGWIRTKLHCSSASVGNAPVSQWDYQECRPSELGRIV